MRGRRRDLFHRQRGYLLDFHGRIAGQPAVLGRDLAGAIDELPGWVGQDGSELAASDKRNEVVVDVGHSGETVSCSGCR